MHLIETNRPLLTDGKELQSISNDFSWAEQALHHAEQVRHPHFWRDGNTINWEQKKKDFKILYTIDELLKDNIHLSATGLGKLIPVIKSLLLKTQLFENNESNLDHSLEVLKRSIEYNFSGESNLIVRRMQLWAAILHDVGKIFGASGIESRFHPFLSVFLVSEFFHLLTDIPPELVQMTLNAIQYHHTMEEIARGLIDDKEFENRFYYLSTLALFWGLNEADIRSSDKYLKYLFTNEIVLISIFGFSSLTIEQFRDRNYKADFQT